MDGFRFDLMGLIDLETMQELEEELTTLKENIILYGEGWNAGESVYQEETALSTSLKKLNFTGGFNNVFRRGIQNYICGNFGDDGSSYNSVRFGLVGALPCDALKESMGSWTNSAWQSVNYTTCHDGYTLWDLLRITRSDLTSEELLERNKLGISAVMLSLGLPFFQSGEEFCRTKSDDSALSSIVSNSYNAGDEINSIKWDQLQEHAELTAYYQGLIAFRKQHTGFHYETAEELKENMRFTETEGSELIAYTIKEKENLFLYNKIYVVLNPYEEIKNIPLSRGKWKVYINKDHAGTEILDVIKGTEASVEAASALVLVHTGVQTWVIVAISFLFAAGSLTVFLLFSAKKRRKSG